MNTNTLKNNYISLLAINTSHISQDAYIHSDADHSKPYYYIMLIKDNISRYELLMNLLNMKYSYNTWEKSDYVEFIKTNKFSLKIDIENFRGVSKRCTIFIRQSFVNFKFKN